MQKLGFHREGEFTPVGDIILQSNMPKGGNLLRGGISSMTVQREHLHAHSHNHGNVQHCFCFVSKDTNVFHIHAKF